MGVQTGRDDAVKNELADSKGVTATSCQICPKEGGCNGEEEVMLLSSDCFSKGQSTSTRPTPAKVLSRSHYRRAALTICR